MDIAFFMGTIFGFLLGIGFCMFFTNMLGRQILSLLNGKSPKKKKKYDEDFDEDDPVNYWKPKGWRPDNL
jgi:hypothetical protein